MSLTVKGLRRNEEIIIKVTRGKLPMVLILERITDETLDRNITNRDGEYIEAYTEKRVRLRDFRESWMSYFYEGERSIYMIEGADCIPECIESVRFCYLRSEITPESMKDIRDYVEKESNACN